jgi:glycosyltransferase involved in cell wall biosynthesis
MTRWKGHRDFIKLIEYLIKDYPDIQGLFVGGGRPGSSYLSELETLAQKAGVADRITFTGDRLDIRDWMSESELIFNLSSKPPEAFGRTVLESLCLGQPLIAWDHGGAAEILAEMFPEGAVPAMDYQQLEARTREFLTSRPVVSKSNSFSLETSMEKHLAVYKDLVTDHVG